MMFYPMIAINNFQWKQKHQINLLNTRNYSPNDFFIASSWFGVLYVGCLRQETTAKIQERTGHLPGLQRLSGSDGNWLIVKDIFQKKQSNLDTLDLYRLLRLYKANLACCRTNE